MNKKLSNIGENVKKNLRNYILTAGLIFVCAAFVLYNILKWDKSTASAGVIISSGVVAFICSVIIKALLGEKGFALGYNDEKWTKPHDKYLVKSNLADPFISDVDSFYEKKKTELKLKLRKTILANARLKYEDFFDNDANFIEHEHMLKYKYKKELKKNKDFKVAEGTFILDLHQIHAIKRAVKVEIFIPDLFTDYENDLTSYTKKEKSDASVRTKNNSKNIIKGAMVSFVGVYFTATIVFNVATVFTTLFMLGTFLGIGILQLYSNLVYVTFDKVQTLTRKDKLLTEFLIEKIGQEEYKKQMAELEKESKQKPLIQNQQEEVVEVEMTEEQMKQAGLIK